MLIHPNSVKIFSYFILTGWRIVLELRESVLKNNDKYGQHGVPFDDYHNLVNRIRVRGLDQGLTLCTRLNRLISLRDGSRNKFPFLPLRKGRSHPSLSSPLPNWHNSPILFGRPPVLDVLPLVSILLNFFVSVSILVWSGHSKNNVSVD